MTDFATLLDRTIERQTRANLVTFLGRYEHLEFGRARKLDAGETALVLTAIDDFLLDGSFGDLGFAEFRDLTERLSLHAAQEELFSSEEGFRIRNACFDALACIKALEACLSRCLDRAAIKNEGAAAPVHANDR